MIKFIKKLPPILLGGPACTILSTRPKSAPIPRAEEANMILRGLSSEEI